MERKHIPEPESKLTILYALRGLGPVTDTELLQFLVELDLMNYFTMQLNLCDMEEQGDLYVDQTKVSVEGVDGEKIVTYKDKYVNGDLDSSETVNEKITKQMVTEVILKGRVKRVKNIKLKTHTPISELKVPARVQLDANGVPKNYKRIVDGTATAYYGGGGTASGRKAMSGHIAVSP